MITPVVMPQMGLEVTEGIVATIHVVVGARVAEGDPLVELETDKALTEIAAPRAGVVRSIEVEPGDTVELGATLIVLTDEDGEEVVATAPDEAADVSDNLPLAAAPEPADERVGVAAPEPAGERVRAAPVARRAAERLGVSLADVSGTGPRARITLDDVRRAAAAHNGAPRTLAGGERLEQLSAIRRAVARRMTQSQQIPQFALSRDIDATWLLNEKERVSRAGGAKLSVNDLILQSLAETVLRNPVLGDSFLDLVPPQLRHRDGADVGLAVATGRGLLVPVIRRAHERTLAEIAGERARLVDLARAGRLSLEEMRGATISLSNLGAFGVDSFAAMLNPGESAILAVGRAVDLVVPRERGLAVVPTLTLTLTVDHRVVDGAAGGAALAELADLLEGSMVWRT